LSETDSKKNRNVVFDWTRGYNNSVLNVMHNPKGEFMLHADAYHKAAKELFKAVTANRGIHSDDMRMCVNRRERECETSEHGPTDSSEVWTVAGTYPNWLSRNPKISQSVHGYGHIRTFH
jgi:hypothetical protein